MATTDSISKSLSSIKGYEIALMGIFFLLVVFPYPMPYDLGYFIDSTLGMLSLFFAAIAFFYFCHPLVGVLFLIVCYDLLRRSSAIVPNVPTIHYTPSQDRKDAQMAQMNPPVDRTLEEDIIAESAPSTVSLVPEPSAYQPVSAPLNFGGDAY